MLKVNARDLKAGDILEPDGTVVIDHRSDDSGVLVTLKPPRQRAVAYWLPDTWELTVIKRADERTQSNA